MHQDAARAGRGDDLGQLRRDPVADRMWTGRWSKKGGTISGVLTFIQLAAAKKAV